MWIVVSGVSNMNNLFYIVIIASVGALAGVINSSPVEQCPGQSFDNIKERIEVKPTCSKHFCKLPKEENITVIFKFKPEREVKTLKQSVSATFQNVTLPFVGVDGSSACDNIVHADDNSPAACPLAAGKEYIYPFSFFMEAFYPEISVVVHWSLVDQDQNDVICFESPGKVVKKRKSKVQKQ